MSEYCPYTYKGYPAGVSYPWVFAMPSTKERDIRWQAIRKSMKKHNVDCLIAGVTGFMPSAGKNIYYISNYVPFAGRATFFVFPLKGEPQLSVSTELGPQFLHLATETSWIKQITASLYPAQDIVKKIKSLKQEKGSLGLVGFRAGGFSALAYNALHESFPSANLIDASGVLSEAMNEVSRTSEEELAFLKNACRILDLSFEAVAAALKPGVKESELWAVAEKAILENGGWYPHLMIGTSGPRPTFLRIPPSNYTLKRGDLIVFEINGTYGGVTSHICYSLSIGKPDREVEQMFEFCRGLYDSAMELLEKDRTFLEVELDLARQIHDSGNEPETPQMHLYNFSSVMPMRDKPQPGDYFAVHPNFCNPDYTAGAKFGDTVHITKEGKVERLQKTPAMLNIV